MNHFVFENFAQSRRAVASSHAADLVRLVIFERVNQKRNRKRNHAPLHANIARRAREAAAPANFARGQNIAEKFGIDLLI